jgi:ABC-type lipopolysaccharide export system ATPase subunit
VLQNCDLVYVLAEGQVVAVGTPDEVASHPDVRSQYLGDDFDLAFLAAGNPEPVTPGGG